MIEPKTIEIEGKSFVLSKFPAVQGREIIAKYPMSAMPKLGDYAVNEETMLKLMCFVGVVIEGRPEPLALTTRALVDNHCKSWEVLAQLEMAQLEYNCSFFGNGKGSTFLEAITQKAQQLITKTLMDLSQQSSQKSKPRSPS
jgi:hypothetical protein